MKQIGKYTLPCLIALIAMFILSFANLTGAPIAGVTVIIGVIMFFVNKAMEKQPDKGSGLDIKAVASDVRTIHIWLWILLPVAMNFISVELGKLVLPEFVDHLRSRTEFLISSEKQAQLILQLTILALGEEIAWRAFFQRQIARIMPFLPALALTSALFALGHIASGSAIVVLYDVLFVFVNSLIYGIVFKKTDNAWISTIAHLIANLAGVAMMGWI